MVTVTAWEVGTPCLKLEEAEDVTVVTFTVTHIIQDDYIQAMGQEFYALADAQGRRKVALDFTELLFLSAAALGKLITFEKKVKAAMGKLVLCGIRPEIYEIFAVTRLNRHFDIKNSLEDALAAF